MARGPACRQCLPTCCHGSLALLSMVVTRGVMPPLAVFFAGRDERMCLRLPHGASGCHLIVECC
uniref:Secreted protein n=1 Tax=Setaria viridis TaxID=4556 RepID=A0A4U6VZC6_SETVI|nr:hypothetical protein SEVIR_2G370050v2 [Setaria viridis]